MLIFVFYLISFYFFVDVKGTVDFNNNSPDYINTFV